MGSVSPGINPSGLSQSNKNGTRINKRGAVSESLPFRVKRGISPRFALPADEPAMARFHETPSDLSVYLRFFHMEKLSARVAHKRLKRKCFIDSEGERRK
jgi:hypothetical protein